MWAGGKVKRNWYQWQVSERGLVFLKWGIGVDQERKGVDIAREWKKGVGMGPREILEKTNKKQNVKNGTWKNEKEWKTKIKFLKIIEAKIN